MKQYKLKHTHTQKNLRGGSPFTDSECPQRCQLTYHTGQVVTNAEAWFNNSLRPRKPEGSLGQTAQDGHLDSQLLNYDSVVPNVAAFN